MGITVKATGPLFTHGPELIHQAGVGAVREIVQLGMQRLAATLRPRPGGVYLTIAQAGKGKASTGNYRRNLQDTVKDLHGLITDGNVVYGPWLENGRPGTRFRGYSSFRRVGQWMQKQVPRVARAHITKWVSRMSGRG